MKASELRQLSDEELRKKELELREDLFKLHFQHKIRSLENPARLREIRKDIARVHTVLTEQAQA
ncbi:large subunit ribosomal protein L29 [Candidatus Electrothrix aarhusensis]|jgi:large subunit ribosomal protein L29|uniref:Large ribosomal subunit protein uL29 n=1 Tax=Candidatus Electrothrix aarhusensis TaxID=1859131 RepID=A0A3S3U7Q1_9BACT|nr:large subunit ribosomal protein L29 [Candidatus Electrothrix aarhusensis]